MSNETDRLNANESEQDEWTFSKDELDELVDEIANDLFQANNIDKSDVTVI